MQPIWVLVSCPSLEEATNVGKHVLDQRLIACFDVVPREYAAYFWPPKTNQLEAATGSVLILVTFEERYESVKTAVKSMHSDDVPFISYIKLYGVDQDYLAWMQGELESASAS